MSKSTIAILADFPLWLVDERLCPRRWHAPSWLENIYHHFRNSDRYEIHWVTFSREVKHTTRCRQGNQYFHVLPHIPLSLGDKVAYLPQRWLINRELKRIRPDLLHAWGTELCYAYCAAHTPYRKILSFQGIVSICTERSHMGPFWHHQAKREKEILPRFDMITAESEWALQRIAELNKCQKLEMLEYAPADTFLSTVRQPAEHPTCMTAGMDMELKNYDTVVAAFSTPELAHVQLLMAGIPRGSRPNLPDNIKELGGLKREELAELMGSTWCLIHPSKADTGPTVVKEARVMGIPAIVSTECGSQQYIEEGKSGFVIRPDDTQGLVRAVLSVTESRERAVAMGSYGVDKCRQRLSAKRMGECVEELYHRLLG